MKKLLIFATLLLANIAAFAQLPYGSTRPVGYGNGITLSVVVNGSTDSTRKVVPYINGFYSSPFLSESNFLKIFYPLFKLKNDSTGATGYLQRGSLFGLADSRYARIGGGTLTYSLTFNNSGSGDASGTSFNNTASRTLSYNSIGAQAALSGTGFIKASGSTISYDNSTYLTTTTAASTYQTLANIENTVTNSSTLYTSGSAVSKVRDSTFNINKNLYDAVDKTAVRYNLSVLKNNLSLWNKVRALFGNGVIYFGDSITYGQGATLPSLCYAYLLNAMFGGTMVNNAISGNGVRDQNVPLLQTTPLVHSRSGLALYSVVINDIRYYNTTDVQIKYPSRGAVNFLLTAFSGSETLSGSLTTTGTWTTYNAQAQTGAKSNGIKSTTFGDYITYNTTTEKGFYFFAIGGQQGSENFATIQVQIDGVVVENVDTHSGYCQNTNVVDLGFFYPLDGAAHTIKLINNSTGSKSMVIDYVGTLKDPSDCVPAAVADCGMVDQASMITATPAIINSANDYINIQVGRFRKLNYPAIPLHTNDYFQTTNTVDGTHPNDAGYAQMANGHYATITDQNYVPNLIVDNFTARTLTGFPVASETNDGIITAEKYKVFKSGDVSSFADNYVPYIASGKLAVDAALTFDPTSKMTSVYQLGLINSKSAISTSTGASIYSTLGGFSYPFNGYGNIIVQAGSNTGSNGYDIDFVTGTSRALSGYMKGTTGEFNWGYSDGATHVVAGSLINVNGGISTVGNATIGGYINRTGNISSVDWGLFGIALNSNAATYTNTSTAANATITSANINAFGRPTISATNTNVTIDGAATVDILNAPLGGTNVILTNPLALQVRAGLTKLFDLKVTGSTTLSGLTANKVVFSGTGGLLSSTGIGVASQFIKGDGSLDGTTYSTISLAGTNTWTNPNTFGGGSSSGGAMSIQGVGTNSFATINFNNSSGTQVAYVGYGNPSASLSPDILTLGSVSKAIGLSTNNGTTYGLKVTSNVVSFPQLTSAAGIAHIDITTGNLTNSLIATADITNNAVTVGKMATSGTLPAFNGSALTSLTATNLSGLVPVANLGSGSPSNTTALFGDQTYKTVFAPQVTTLSSQTAATSYTPGALSADGTWEVGGYIKINSILVDVLKVQLSWTDPADGSPTTQDYFMQSASPTQLMSAAGNYTFSPLTIRAKSGTSITVSYILTTGGGTIDFIPTSTFTQKK